MYKVKQSGESVVSQLLDEIPARWQQMFESLVAGYDVAPSVRLRTEGLMEAAVLEGLTSAEHLTVQIYIWPYSYETHKNKDRNRECVG